LINNSRGWGKLERRKKILTFLWGEKAHRKKESKERSGISSWTLSSFKRAAREKKKTH